MANKMKRFGRKPFVSLASCFFLPNSASALRIDKIVPGPSRQREARRLSNGMMSLHTFQIYNCEGASLGRDVTIAAAADLSSTVVQYHYDLTIKEGGELSAALASLQEELLAYVGEDIFPGCSRRLVSGGIDTATGRKLGGTIIQEITSAPSDRLLSTFPCVMEDTTNNAECYVIAGYITAYYPSSGDGEPVRRLEESSVQETIANSVALAMDNGALINDETIMAVRYHGDLSPAYDSARSYLVQEASISDLNPSSKGSWWQPIWWPPVVGAAIGALVAVALVLLYKKRSSKKANCKQDKEPFAKEFNEEGKQQGVYPEQEGQEMVLAKETEKSEPAVVAEEGWSKEGFDSLETNSTIRSNSTTPTKCNFLEVLSGEDVGGCG